ncbi:MAG: leucine-rich repeat domain-containing protein [Prevotellaceae bacterium]|nr:leucine-rich repeat domain-containing protein [Prevotellaceae bacterium]
MGFFKKFLSDAANELKKNLESTKNEMSNALEEIKQDTINSASNSRDDDEEDDEEPKNLLGDFHDGVLTIREGITKIDDDSLEDYKHLRKIIFPASLEEIDDDAIDNQEELEELDFSRVTKLKTIPDSMVYCETKITQLIIPHGVTKVNDCFLREANPGVKVYVPDTVKEIGCISGNSDNDLIVYLFAHNLDVEEMEPDVKTLYVLPQDYASYARKLKDCESEARLREMPEEAMNIYPVAKSEPDSEPKVTAEPKQEPKFESMPELKSEPQKEETSGASDDGIFSARLEMLIKSALQDGILTEQERAIILRRAEKEGEDPDEVEMIIEARLAEMKQSTSPSEPNIKSESVSSTPKPNVENGGSYEDLLNKKKYEDLLNKKKKELDDAKKVAYDSGANLLKYNTLHKEYTELLAAMKGGAGSISEVLRRVEEEAAARKKAEEEQAKEKEQMKLQTILGYSEAKRYSNERNVDIPEGYIELGEWCFQDSHLQSICLPSTLEKINDNAFNCCNKMKKVDFSKCTSLIEIGDEGFYSCEKLEEIVLPDSVTTIGDGAFKYCTNLRKIVMPSSLENLGDSVFEHCDSLEEVDMSKVTKLTTIPKRFKTWDVEQMVIPMGVTTIRKDAFIMYCSNYALFLPPTLKDYMDTNVNWVSVYLFASPLENMDNIFENSNNLYVLPQYLEVYKSIHEALGEYSGCKIHTMPDEFMFFYDN